MLLIAGAALLAMAAAPVAAASCCGKTGKAEMCGKAGMSASMSGKKGCCCQGMGANMSKRQHKH